MAGIPYALRLPLPLDLTLETDRDGLFVNDQELLPSQRLVGRGTCDLVSQQTGSLNIQMRLFGLVPIRRLNVEVLPPIEVVPSGHSIGVTISATTMVVGHATIKSASGDAQPAKQAGLRLGDLIIGINDLAYPSVATVAEEILRAGEDGHPIRFRVKRDGQELAIDVPPVLCQETGKYRVGLYVRDDAAGVGTLTFVDRESMTFGALGHIVADVDTNHPLEVREGRVMLSRVTSINQGKSGSPGEKRSIIVDNAATVGTFTINTSIGIYGELLEDITTAQPLPVALVDEVKPGKAEMWTVVEGEEVRPFEIDIVRVTRQSSPGGKGMVVRVSDPALLEMTGGIVQGMSGSPIVQNGRLVGAITHVFVNRPDSGYAVFAEWMVRESGLLEKRQQAAPTFFHRRDMLRNAGGI